MSGQDQEEVETEAPVVQGKERAPGSGAQVLGRLAGAGAALPTMAIAYLVAVLAGVPGPTAVIRSLVSALVMWVFVALAVRLLFGVLLEDWKRARRSRSRPEVDG